MKRFSSEISSDKVYIFGAGDYGKKMYLMLKLMEITVVAFIDNNADKQGTIIKDNVRCIPVSEGERSIPVIAALAKNAAIVCDTLKEYGFDRVIDYDTAAFWLNQDIEKWVRDVGCDLVKYMAETGVGSDKCFENGCYALPIHFYQPIPDIADLRRRNIWDKKSALAGINWTPEQYVENVKNISGFQRKQGWQQTGIDPLAFYTENNSFSFLCASYLYGMIHKNRPKRIIEIGSGNSSKVIRTALIERNGIEQNGTYTIIDPYCSLSDETFHIAGVNIQFIRKPVEEVDLSLFEQLEKNDILFIDSSHTVRIGGDVNFEILEVLPRLKSGVIIHFHDIPMPYEYEKIYATNSNFRVFWTESYLLQAFLAFNREFEIIIPARWLSTVHLELLKKCYSSMTKPFDWSSESMWIRRK